jgi:hypothetical protein
MLVLTATRRVARWAARAASVRGPLGTRLELRPVVLYLGREAVEALLDPEHPELAWLAAWAMHRRHGFRKFRLELEARGEARGEAKGKAEGKAEGKQEALLLLLSTRELPVSSAQRRRIQGCTDLEVLDRWIQRAARASSADDVLEPAARSPRKAAAKQARPATRRSASRA